MPGVAFGNFDQVHNARQMETIRREERTRAKHASGQPKERSSCCAKSLVLGSTGSRMTDILVTPRSPLSAAGSIQTTPRNVRPHTVSASVRFLEEKTGLDETDERRPDTRDLLYRGVSHDGKGRAEYLKLRKKYDVVQRHGIPMTVTHEFGLGQISDKTNYLASPNCKKPVIQRSFFRTMGVDTYRGLPNAS
eukprot:TRINITY_DN26001_c0_g1_i1.p1 TRINITY_DN26001_c0_g1~~TRINITY_DN26001_c0_g1_i1.p1  ORF type:complete len:212 (+),score=26.60 TRINITY_DN26001_c0_g1_i1:62-637(+)